MVSKKYLLFFNILLAAVFAFKLYSLHAKIGPKVKKKPGSLDYTFVEVKRPSVQAAAKFRNIFGVKPMEITKAVSHQDSRRGHLNELVTKDEIIRLQGIFITKDLRYAVILIADRKRRNKEVVTKVGIGDKIKNFTVDSILPGSVGLAHDSSDIIHLKIFKPFF